MPEPSTCELKICPYLGTEEDRETCVQYPSSWNVCHHCRPVSGVRLNHQRSICLSPQFAACPVFHAGPSQPLPVALKLRARRY